MRFHGIFLLCHKKWPIVTLLAMGCGTGAVSHLCFHDFAFCATFILPIPPPGFFFGGNVIIHHGNPTQVLLSCDLEHVHANPPAKNSTVEHNLFLSCSSAYPNLNAEPTQGIP